MGAMTKILKEIEHEMPGEMKIKSPGPAFDALCKAFPLKAIGNGREYSAATGLAEAVAKQAAALKEKGSKTREELLAYLEPLGILIEDYEREHFPSAGKGVTGADMLKYLMREHRIKQVDLKGELGGQSIVSDILSGKRKLNARQIGALARRFHVSPAVFFDG